MSPIPHYFLSPAPEVAQDAETQRTKTPLLTAWNENLCVFASLREPNLFLLMNPQSVSKLVDGEMKENAISTQVIDAAVKIHRMLGPGLLESVYERVLTFELEKRGLNLTCQVLVSIDYEGIRMDEGFRADIIVEDKVILELKAVEQLAKVHHRQLFTYLKLTGMKLGLLLNYGAPLMRDGIVRIVHGLPE